jgi:hypothetical protein
MIHPLRAAQDAPRSGGQRAGHRDGQACVDIDCCIYYTTNLLTDA